MSISELISYITAAIGLAGILGGAGVIVRGSAIKQTIASQKELINTLQTGKAEMHEEIVLIKQKHESAVKDIGVMQGKIDVLSTLPLQQISADLSNISKNQTEIVRLLSSRNSQ